jgi:electron transfer flavoprotein beta subunit
VKIAVTVKQVPDSWAEKKFVSGRVDRESVDAVLNDLDEYAIEEALRICEANGGTVDDGGEHTITLISMGPARAQEAVRKGLSMGASSAIVITDPALAGADAMVTSEVLAKVIAEGGYDFVISGVESTDARMSVIPAMVSARLGHAQLTFANRVNVDVAAKKISINRITDTGESELEANFPVVISVVEKINEPRYPSFKGIMAAKKKEIASKDLAAIGGAGSASWTEVIEANAKPPKAAGTKIEDDGSAAAKLVDFLAERKLI